MGKIRLGFIGAGWWATANHMPILAARDDVEMTTVCRLGQDELERVRERFGFRYATEDYRELLARPLDAVVVTTPPTRCTTSTPGRRSWPAATSWSRSR